MSDKNVSLVQDTGNPVLDSTVNLLMSKPNYSLAPDHLREVHKVILELLELEPPSQKRKHVQLKDTTDKAP